MKKVLIIAIALSGIIACKKDATTTGITPTPPNLNETKILNYWNISSIDWINTYGTGNKKNIIGKPGEDFFDFKIVNEKKAVFIKIQDPTFSSHSGEYTFSFYSKDDLNRDIIKLVDVNTQGYYLYTIKELTETDLTLYRYLQFSGYYDETTIKFKKKI